MGEGDPEKYHGSNGWFDKFKKRFGLQNVKLLEAASADQNAASKYPEDLQKLIKDYLPKQVFNAYEIRPFWKGMPDRKFIAMDKKTA